MKIFCFKKYSSEIRGVGYEFLKDGVCYSQGSTIRGVPENDYHQPEAIQTIDLEINRPWLKQFCISHPCQLIGNLQFSQRFAGSCKIRCKEVYFRKVTDVDPESYKHKREYGFDVYDNLESVPSQNSHLYAITPALYRHVKLRDADLFEKAVEIKMLTSPNSIHFERLDISGAAMTKYGILDFGELFVTEAVYSQIKPFLCSDDYFVQQFEI